MSKPTPRLYEFGPFAVDVSERLLRREGQAVALTPKVFDTLLVLLQSKGRVVGKDELMQRLWPDTLVEEGSLSQNIFLLRRALGEGTSEPRYVETLPKRGYRFVADVREVAYAEEESEANADARGASDAPAVVAEAGAPAAGRNQTEPARVEAIRPKWPRYVYVACAVLILAGSVVYFGLARRAGESGEGFAADSVAV